MIYGGKGGEDRAVSEPDLHGHVGRWLRLACAAASKRREPGSCLSLCLFVILFLVPYLFNLYHRVENF